MDQPTTLTAIQHPNPDLAPDLEPDEARWPADGQVIDDLRLITIPDAAERLGLCRSKVYQLIAEDKLPTIKIGRARRVSMEDLRTFVAGHRTARTGPRRLKP